MQPSKDARTVPDSGPASGSGKWLSFDTPVGDSRCPIRASDTTPQTVVDDVIEVPLLPAGPARDREHDGRRGVGVTWFGVARRAPTDNDRHEAIETVLNGLAHGDDLGDVADRLAPLHPSHNTFPGEVLLDLAADAISVSGASRQSLLEFEGIRERYLADGIAHTKAQHHKSKYALRAAAMLHGGVDPGLLDEIQWWRTDDLWYWSLEALATYVHAAADRTGQTVKSICRQIANERDVTLVGDDAP